MDSEESVKNEYVFFKSRWSVDASGDVSFAFPDFISYVIDQENREMIRIVLVEEIRRMFQLRIKS